jgi:hypothetical protein
VDTKLLIDSIARQTTVLIAHLSAAAGIRAPLAHLADQVFLNLSRELEAQGLSRKVVADMFGMELRGYQRRVQRLRESATDTGTTLWQAVLEHLQQQGPLTRRAILDRFFSDDPAAVGAVLKDLLNSGLAYKTGSGNTVLFGVTPDEDRLALAQEKTLEMAATLVWLDLCRHPGASREEVLKRLPLEEETLEAAIDTLKKEGRASVDPTGTLVAEAMVIPVGAEVGWEAALFDHFQAVCAAMVTKLSRGATRSHELDTTGGATLTFVVSAGHPFAERVMGLLATVRAQLNELWHEVEAYNAEHPLPEDQVRRVTFYCGQFVKPSEEDA